MGKEIGKCDWYIPDAFYPAVDQGESYVSHEAVCVLNTGDKDAHIQITLYFEDREPLEGFEACLLYTSPVTERRLSIQEVYEAHDKGVLEEVFGTGTAAVISPVGELDWEGNVIKINNGEIGELSQKIYDATVSYTHLEVYCAPVFPPHCRSKYFHRPPQM